MKKIFFCLMAMCMLLVSCNVTNNENTIQEEQQVEVTEPFNFIEEPQQVNCSYCYTVFQTLGDDYGLACSFEEPTIVILITDSVCYDGLQLSTTDTTEFKMIGTYNYQSIDSLYRTVPILKLYTKTE